MDLSCAFQLVTKYAPVDPVTSAILRSFHDLSQFLSQIKAVDEQTRDLLSTTNHVRFNVKEAHRLRRTKAPLLDTSERSWIDSVIRDTEYALLEIARLVEPARADLSVRKSVEFQTKLDWVFKQNIKVAEKHARLNTFHQSLLAVITSLNLKTVKAEMETISEEHPSPHDPQMQRFLNFQVQRNMRRSTMSLRSEGSSAGSRSTTSSASMMTNATRFPYSGSITTSSVETSSKLLLPDAEVLNLELSHGDNKVFADFSSPFTSTIRRKPLPLTSKVPALRSNTDPSDVRNDLGTDGFMDYFAISQNLETSTHASMDHTQAADTEYNTGEVRDDGDKTTSTTASLSPPYFPGADGLQVYDPYSPYHLPPFLPPLHTRASTSKSIQHPSELTASPQEVQCSPDLTEEIPGCSTKLDHDPQIQQWQQRMRRAFSDSSQAPELHRPGSAASLAVSAGAQRSMSAGRGGACRAKRSWLTLHASRVNSSHGIGWQDA